MQEVNEIEEVEPPTKLKDKDKAKGKGRPRATQDDNDDGEEPPPKPKSKAAKDKDKDAKAKVKQRKQAPPEEDSDVQLVEPPKASVDTGKRKSSFVEDEEVGPARKRPKQKALPDGGDEGSVEEVAKPAPKKRGRPPKSASASAVVTSATEASKAPAKKGRPPGRPAKVSDVGGGGGEDDTDKAGDAPKKKRKIQLFGTGQPQPRAFDWGRSLTVPASHNPK